MSRPTTCLPRGRLPGFLVVALAYMVCLTVDQMYWWRIKADYAFGWLVPVFVGYVLLERRAQLTACLAVAGPDEWQGMARRSLNLLAALAMAGGLAVFTLGALYRAGSGATQPGSLALAAGFAAILPALAYFSAPAARLSGAPGVRGDARVRAAGLVVFPALVWLMSAPLVSAVEGAISLFLLRKVVVVVFSVFGFLGFPLVQEGNVLMLPHGQVGVADACSGIRSLTGCLFAGSFLAAVFLDRWWKKILLIAAAMAFAFGTNLLRSLFLTSWAYAYGSAAIEGTLHDATGYAVLGLTCVGLFGLMPLFNGENWRRWVGLGRTEQVTTTGAEAARAIVEPARSPASTR